MYNNNNKGESVMTKVIKVEYEKRKKLYYSTNNVEEKSWDGLINQNLDMMFVFKKVIQEFGIAYSDAFKTHQKCYPNLYFKENQ